MKVFYSSSFFEALAQHLVVPFIPLYALAMGATKTLIGMVSSLPTFVDLIFQSFGGCISEAVCNKKVLVVFGGLVWALLWIPIALASNVYHLIALLLVQSTFSAITVPAWTFLFVQYTPKFKRGEISGNLNFYTALGSLLGSLVAGYMLNKYGFIYFVFLLAFTFGFVSKLIFLRLKQPVFPTKDLRTAVRSTFSFKEFRDNKKLFDLTKAILFFNFSVSIAGPFFSVYVIKNLNGTTMDVAIISALGIISNMAFYRSWGTLIDYLGAKSVMTGCLVPISLVPLVYALSNNVLWIYMYTIFGQMAWSGFNVASFVYLSNSLPKENGASSVGMYNMITRTGTALAPLLGGIVADWVGIRSVLILSTVFRFASFYFLNMIEEKTGLKPQGVLRVWPQTFGVFYTFELFIYTYSMLVESMTKDFLKSMKRKRYVT
jgi:MFS family permease